MGIPGTNSVWLLEGRTTMSGSSEYQCGQCHHRFRTPEGAPLDVRTLMCPACGSIDLNLVTVQRPAPPVLVARERTPAEHRRAKSRAATS